MINQKFIHEIGQKHGIHFTLNNMMDDTSDVKISRKIDSIDSEGSRQAFLGCKPAHALYTIELNLYENYYFLEEELTG